MSAIPDQTGKMIQLYGPSGDVIFQGHPNYDSKIREINFSTTYNPDPTRRGRAPWLAAKAGSENWIANRDRMKAMADARDAVQYDWIGGVLARLVLYIAGKIHCKSDTGDDQVDIAYDEYFHGWCGDEVSEDGQMRHHGSASPA